ncbi:MAG TPA: DUF4089 domain-containing protein [Bordetella sp.]
MSADTVLHFVRASATLLGLPLDDAQAGRVAAHMARTAGMARLLEAAPLAEDDEPAEVYRPAPFPEAPGA